MVKVKAGERKKKLIIDTCKTLYYQHGFNNTTYEMICQAADIAPGSITYHFSSKLGIASVISKEFDDELRRYTSSFATEEEVGHWAYTALIVRMRWVLLLSDPNLRRFYAELYDDETRYESLLVLLRIHEQFLNTTLTDNQLHLIVCTTIGQDSMILDTAAKEPERFTVEEICDYVTDVFFKLLGIPEESATEAIEKGRMIFQSIEDKIDLDYFREFEYSHSD